MFHSACLLALFGLSQLDHANAFYYNQYHANPPVQPVMLPEASDLYPAYDPQQRSDVSEQESNGNAYSNQAALWLSAQPSTMQNLYVNKDEPSQQDSQYYQMSRDILFGAPTSPESQNVCATGFVEHCLVKANADGEQRLLLASMVANRTGASEQDTLTSEFDGMCHVVTRFIDCLNAHYLKCSPVNRQIDQQVTNAKDMFAESWAQLCAPDSMVRRKYIEHATCIKQALSENNGQEQCQARFQTYFMSGQFSLDSIENAVHFGCCAFNEWQHCIDSLIVRQCGHEAMKSVQDLIEMASGGLVSSLCDKKSFGRKSKACMGKKGYGIGSAKLQSLDPKINATLHKYIGIFGDFIDRLPDDDE